MSYNSTIEWTDTTWSPIRVRVKADAARIATDKGYTSLIQIAEKQASHVGHHCEPVSDGCKHCYSGTWQARCFNVNGTGLPFDRRSRDLVEVFMDEKVLMEPLKWRQIRLHEPRCGKTVLGKQAACTCWDKYLFRPRRIFVENQSDLFGEWVTDEQIDRVFAIMALSQQHHNNQVLTKRVERMLTYVSAKETPFRIAKQIDSVTVDMAHAGVPYEIRAVPGLDGKYLLDTNGKAFTLNGSLLCVWCGGLNSTTGAQDTLYCGVKCRSASHYAKTKGQNTEPSGRTPRPVVFDVGTDGHLRLWVVGGARELVHRLMLETFVRTANTDEQACHVNGNPVDNRISNLRWGTQEDNMRDRWRHGNGRSWAKLGDDQVAGIRRDYVSGESAQSIAPRYNVSDTQVYNVVRELQHSKETPIEWPLNNCWLGVSVEDTKTWHARVPLLKRAPAAKRFVSYEPALANLDITIADIAGLDLVIIGGESGPGARAFNIQWALNMIRLCAQAGVACFVKQLGALPIMDENQWHAIVNATGKARLLSASKAKYCPAGYVALSLGDKKGGSMVEWPEELRVRELPQ